MPCLRSQLGDHRSKRRSGLRMFISELALPSLPTRTFCCVPLFNSSQVTRMRSELRSGARLTEGLRAELAHSQFDLQDLRNQLAAREVLVQNLQRELEDLEEAMEDIKHSISRGLGMVIVPPQQLRQEKPASLQSRPAEQEQLQHVALCDKQEEQQQQQQQDQEPRKGLLGFISSLFGNNGRGKGTQASGPSSGTANNVVAAEGLSATEVSRREQMSARR
uniref:Uncharacterized protein n=1 Tax=Dunaliella tertiolecta TaxID=3047 RepID=A0A7S3R6Y8_DUNTE